jgi:hypothetical protein
MEELDKVIQALSVVERYEEYLFRKTWGRVLIVIGTVLPLGAIVSMNALIVADALGLDVGMVSLLVTAITLILCFGFVSYAFFGSWKTTRKQPTEVKTDSKHGPLIGIVWFLAFMSTAFLPEVFRMVSLLWAASVSCLISFVILRTVGSHGQDRVLLYLGISLGLASVPLLLISNTTLVAYVALGIFSVCFILAGIAMNKLAAGMLQPSS